MRPTRNDTPLEPSTSQINTPLDLRAIDYLVGQVLESRYRIDEEVGRGGMGIVYRGTDLTLSRPIAIKTILHKRSDDEALSRFIREAKTLAQIEHPRLVPVYAVGQDEGYHYLVMKFLEGETLASRLKREGAQAPNFTRNVIQQVCEALNALHIKNLIHRDIKPANLMISPEGRITVMDLGIVKKVGEENNSTSSMAIGTPRYMPPEAVDSKPLDPRADLYSLGIIAYQMLLGEAPFNGPTPMAILYQQAHILPPRIREKSPQTPKNLDFAIDIALQKDPEQRFQNAVEMSQAFDPSAEFIHPGQWRSKALLIAFIAGLLGTLLIMGDVFQWKNDSDTPKRVSPNQLIVASTSTKPSKAKQTKTKTQNSLNHSKGKTVDTQNKKPKPEESTTVKVWLKSQPRNAKIYLSNRYIGKTPYRLVKPRGETKVYTLKLKGFKDHPLVVRDHDAKAQLKSIFGGFR